MYYSFIFIPLFISYICIHRKFTGTTKKYIHDEHFDKWNTCTVLYMVPPPPIKQIVQNTYVLKKNVYQYVCYMKCLENSFLVQKCFSEICTVFWVCLRYVYLNSDYRLKWTSPGAISTMNFYPHPLPTPSSSESWKPGWSVTPSMCTGRVWTLCPLPFLLSTSTMRVNHLHNLQFF